MTTRLKKRLIDYNIIEMRKPIITLIMNGTLIAIYIIEHIYILFTFNSQSAIQEKY